MATNETSKYKLSITEGTELQLSLNGPTGAVGPANVLAIGNVATAESGINASATITGTSPSQTLNLTLPKGDTGTAATVEVSNTITTFPGTQASVVNLGDSSAAVFQFRIPRGDKGETGSTGPTGPTGATTIPATTSKNTPVDADSVVILDSSASNGVKNVPFSNLWTWIKSKIDAGLTIAGSQSFSGQVEMTGQILNTNNSALTRNLADARYSKVLDAATFGVVYNVSDDTTATANSVALSAAFAASSSTGSVIEIRGIIYTKGQNLIDGTGIKITGINKAKIIQKDILHNGLTLSESTPPASLSISNLSLAGQGYATHLTAGIYGRRASGAYFFSDINLINIGISGFDMGLDFRNIVKLYTNNVSVYSCRVGYNMDKVDTYLIENTRIVGSSSTADIPNSVCFKFSDQSFGGKVVMGEFGGEHIARFCEISGDGVEAVFEGCNLELFTSAQVNTITSTGAHTFVFRDGRCTRRLDGANTDAFISMNTSGNRVNSVEIVNLSDWPFSGRVVETYGGNSGPTVSGAPVKLTYTTSAAAAATAEYLVNVGVRDWPVTASALPVSSVLRGETILWTPSTITRGTDDWMQAPMHKLYNNRSGTVQWFTSINAQLMQVIGSTQDGSSVVGTGTILTATLPAGMLYNTGESISLRISGKTAANTNSKQIRIKLNGYILFDSAVFTSSGVDWKLDFECHTGNGHEKWDAQLFVADVAYGINGTKLASGDTGPATWYGNSATAGVFTVETVTPTAAGDVTYRNGKAFWSRGPSTNSIS